MLPRRLPDRSPKAYSLYELLMTLALVSLVLTIGLPSFGRIVAGQRLRAEIDGLFHAIHLARKSSVARRRVVSLCPSTDGLQCDAGTDWSRGWLMFVNGDRDVPPHVDPGEAVLRYHRGDPDVAIHGNRAGFTLRATEQRATNGTLLFCDRQQRISPRALVISYTGRPRVAYADSRGQTFACPD